MVFRVLLILFLFLILSCYNQLPLTGGPQDLVPPKIVWSEPTTNQKNVDFDKVRFHFDEFVELNNPNENILISPLPLTRPKITINGKSVTIHFGEPLKQNTTYYIQTLQAFKDYTEGNLLENSELLFSTGKNLDTSNYFIALNATNGPLSNLTRVVMTKDTTSFFKGDYSYVSIQKENKAKFPNLNNENYFVFAFVDSNKNNKWDINESVGFVNNKINKKDSFATINLFLNESQVNSAKFISINNQLYKLSFQKLPFNLSCFSPCDNVITFQLDPNEVYYLFKNPPIQDSFEYTIGDLHKKRLFKPNKIQEPLKRLSKTANSRNNETKDPDQIEFYFNYIIQNIDSQLINIKSDSGSNPSFKLAYSNNKLTIKGLDYEKNYKVIINKNAILSSKGYNLTRDSIEFSTISKLSIRDSLEFTFLPPIEKKVKAYLETETGYIPLLINNSRVVLNHITKDALNFVFFEDLNNNNTWDSGIIRDLKQPEPIYHKSQPITAEKKYQITWK